MAVLAVAAAGAAIGGAVGGTFLGVSAVGWGWAIGSVVGNALFAPKTNAEGPRLTEIRFSQSSYGATLPLVFGSMRVGGNVIWMGEVREVTNRQKVGKNAYQTSYTYLQSFVVAIAEGPIQGVRKIWFDSELVYDASSGNGLVKAQGSGPVADILTIYLGGEDQAPSALIEAAEGVGNVPAYRGVALLEFEELDLTKYGNRVPSVTAEVIEAATETVPVTLGSVGFMDGMQAAVVRDGLIYTAQWPLPPGPGTSSPYQKVVKVWTMDGELRHEYRAYSDVLYPYGSSGVSGAARGCANDIDIAYGSYVGDYDYPTESENFGSWLLGQFYWPVNGMLMMDSSKMPGPQNYSLGMSYLIRTETHLYGYAGNLLMRWEIQNGIPASQPDKTLIASDLPDVNGTVGTGAKIAIDGDRLYLKTTISDISTATFYWIFVFDLDLEYVATIKNYPVGKEPIFDDFAVWNGQVLFTSGYTAGGYDVTQCSVSYSGTEGTLEEMGTASNFNTFNPNVPMFVPIGGGNFLSWGHEFSMVPALTLSGRTLADVLSRLSTKAGLSSGEIDVSDVDDITVDGFLIDRRTSCRSAIEPLLVAYNVDAVESNGKIAFRSRGASAVATVRQDDLGASADEGTDAQRVSVIREQAGVLPQQVDVSYADVDAAYEIGTQIAQRGQVLSDQKVSVSLPIAADAETAAQAAHRILYGLWAQRNRRQFSTSMAYSHLEPADPVYLEEQDGSLSRLRLVSKIEDDGLINWEAIDDDDGVPVQVQSGASLPTPSTIKPTALGSLLHVFESPPLNDQDAAAPTIYAAAVSYDPTNWQGSFLWANSVGGADYAQLGEFAAPAVGGYALSALPDWSPSRMGEDPSTVQVQVTGGDLASASDSELDAGSNTAVLGSEIIQFKSVTDDGDGAWTLTGVRRALHGTDQFAVDHEIGERFVLINNVEGDILPARRPVADIGVAREYRAVAPRQTVTEAQSLIWTPAGRSMYPLPPAHITMVRQANGDRTVRWVRRARAQQMWRDYIDMPLIESVETYRVRIYNPYTSATLRTEYVTGANSWTYTAANIATDWGDGNRVFLVGIGITQYSDTVGYQDEATAVVAYPQSDNVRFGRDWSDNSTAGQTLFSSEAGSSHSVTNGAYELVAPNTYTDVKSRLDNSPNVQDAFIEADVYSTIGDRLSSIVARTTSWWDGGNAGFAWEVFVHNGAVGIAKGTNASSDTRTVVDTTPADTYERARYYRIGWMMDGDRHVVYVDGELLFDITDSTHESAGQIGFRRMYGFETYFDNLVVRY